MALTYDETAKLKINGPFIGRVTVACTKFADAIYGENTTVTAHNTRLRWAQNVVQNPDQIGQQVAKVTVIDAAVQAAGIDATDGDSTLDDNALQGSVETTVLQGL